MSDEWAMKMSELAHALYRYAPQLTPLEMTKWGMHIINKYGLDDLDNLNLANEWQEYRENLS